MNREFVAGVALTGVGLVMVPWFRRQEWKDVNRHVVDNDFDCEDLSQYGLPCFNTHHLDELAPYAAILAGLSLMAASRPWQWSRHGGRKR